MPSSKASFIFPDAKYSVSKEQFQNAFDANIPPVLTILPGDLVQVETNDCFHGQITPDLPNPSLSVMELDYGTINPVTGPIFVEGAQPGDILSVTFLDIRPQGVGVACCGPDSGQLCHWIPNKTTKFFDLSEHGKVVTMRDSLLESNSNTKQKHKQNRRLGPIAFPASPMLGVIGVAPAGMDPIPAMPAGKHGGNLDNRCNGIGSTIYFPVHHPGALLSMGDMHASQGDGEISGNGVEIGGHVLLKCEILKEQDLYPNDDGNSKLKLQYPVTETETHWITHGVVVENIPQTTTVACEEAAKILMGQWGFTAEEAFIFLSVQGDLGLCQSCHPDKGTQIAKMSVPKLKNVCPRPFRILHDTPSASS